MLVRPGGSFFQSNVPPKPPARSGWLPATQLHSSRLCTDISTMTSPERLASKNQSADEESWGRSAEAVRAALIMITSPITPSWIWSMVWRSRDMLRTYPYAIGPRLGIAYQIAPKTVLRVGWGLVYGTTAVVNYQLGGALGTGFNTLTFTNQAYGQPALALRDGLQYNPSDLYAAALYPGLRPSP